jgi:hypothetical protein
VHVYALFFFGLHIPSLRRRMAAKVGEKTVHHEQKRESSFHTCQSRAEQSKAKQNYVEI